MRESSHDLFQSTVRIHLERLSKATNILWVQSVSWQDQNMGDFLNTNLKYYCFSYKELTYNENFSSVIYIQYRNLCLHFI